MTRKVFTEADSATDEASRWFVRVDSGEPGAEVELARWLAERPEHERGMERVELAAALARRLAAEPSSALFAEAAQAARLEPRRRPWGRALAWGGAMAAGLLVAVFVVRDGALPATSLDATTIDAARVVGFDAPSNPVAVLPSGVVVDASAVAVLPFAAAGDVALAEGLERDVAAALRKVPGLYVIADAAVQPYAATELEASEVGGLLGARGLVDATVELSAGRVLVDVQLRESATGATLWEGRFDRPVDDLRAVRDEMADRIASTMLDASLRPKVDLAEDPDAEVAASKPFQQ